MADTIFAWVPRCDRCRFWQRDEHGRPAYPDNRSMCLMNGAKGMACTFGTLTTEGDFGCVRFQLRTEKQ
jgi:hypothetical protein